jgi:hypothetical protein
MQAILDVNLSGVFYCMQAQLKQFSKQVNELPLRYRAMLMVSVTVLVSGCYQV